jgi:hypothetical protein
LYSAIVCGTAATTGIAGILHLILVPRNIGFNINTATFFLIAGILQLYWIFPVLRQWGRIWYYVGIGGTAVLITMWAITRIPNPITGRAGSISEMAIAIEILQVAFIILLGVIIRSKG